MRKGGNYGWNVKEGTHCYATASCPDRTPESVRGGETLVDPVVEYPHDGQPVSGLSVIVGNVYRGETYPGLQGRFLFGDYRAKGRLFVATPRDEGRWPTDVLPVAASQADRLEQLFSLHRHDGDFYVLGSGVTGGGVYRIV